MLCSINISSEHKGSTLINYSFAIISYILVWCYFVAIIFLTELLLFLYTSLLNYTNGKTTSLISI